jgi:hypothetical protein
MQNTEYQRNYFKRRYASDPEFRSRCNRSCRNSRLKKDHGITLEEFEAQLAAQHGACACCGNKLGRVRRVHRKADGAIGLLCQRCCKLVASLRHVRKHADAFEAYMKEWGMTVELGRFYEVMRRCGWTPEQSASGGRPT